MTPGDALAEKFAGKSQPDGFDWPDVAVFGVGACRVTPRTFHWPVVVCWLQLLQPLFAGRASFPHDSSYDVMITVHAAVFKCIVVSLGHFPNCYILTKLNVTRFFSGFPERKQNHRSAHW